MQTWDHIKGLWITVTGICLSTKGKTELKQKSLYSARRRGKEKRIVEKNTAMIVVGVG